MFNKIVEQTAEELNLPKSKVHKVGRSIFNFVLNCIRNKETVRLQYFGTFGVKPGRALHFRRLDLLKEEVKIEEIIKNIDNEYCIVMMCDALEYNNQKYRFSFITKEQGEVYNIRKADGVLDKELVGYHSFFPAQRKLILNIFSLGMLDINEEFINFAFNMDSVELRKVLGKKYEGGYLGILRYNIKS